MVSRKPSYKIGSLVSVQDETGNVFAICRIEAADMRGSIIGRFFLRSEKDESGRARPIGDSFVWQFGDLHIVKGKWPIVGFDNDFSTDATAKFQFFHKNPLPTQNRIDTYDKNVALIASQKIPTGLVPDLPPSLLMGALAVEVRLKSVIAGTMHPHFQH